MPRLAACCKFEPATMYVIGQMLELKTGRPTTRARGAEGGHAGRRQLMLLRLKEEAIEHVLFVQLYEERL